MTVWNLWTPCRCFLDHSLDIPIITGKNLFINLFKFLTALHYLLIFLSRSVPDQEHEGMNIATSLWRFMLFVISYQMLHVSTILMQITSDFLHVITYFMYWAVFNLVRSFLISINHVQERFLIDCCKTRTKVINLYNHKGQRQYSEPMKT